MKFSLLLALLGSTQAYRPLQPQVSSVETVSDQREYFITTIHNLRRSESFRCLIQSWLGLSSTSPPILVRTSITPPILIKISKLTLVFVSLGILWQIWKLTMNVDREWRCGNWSADGNGRLQQAAEPEWGEPFSITFKLIFSQGCRKLLWLPYRGCTKQWQHVLLVLPSRGEPRDCPCSDLAPGRSWRFFYVRRPQAPWTCYHHREFYPS